MIVAKGAVISFELEYSKSAMELGDSTPIPPSLISKENRSRSAACSSDKIIAGMSLVKIASSKGVSSSLMSMSVLRKYLNLC